MMNYKNLHDEWHDPLGVQDVSTAIEYIGELERGAEEASDYVGKQQQLIESLRKKMEDNDAVSEHDWQKQAEAYNALIGDRDKWKLIATILYKNTDKQDPIFELHPEITAAFD